MSNEISIGLTNLWSFHLCISGVLITLITVLYSFLLNEKDQWLFYVGEVKTNHSPEAIRKSRMAKKYILRLKKAIQWCFVLLCVSAFLALVSLVFYRMPILASSAKIAYYIILPATVLWFALVIVLFVILVKQYRADTESLSL